MTTYEVEVQEETDLLHAKETWLLDGKKHREGDLPALTYKGDKFWYKHDRLHRTNGAACEYASGTKSYYLDGKGLTKAEHDRAMNPHKELTIAEIEKLLGYKVKIIKEK